MFVNVPYLSTCWDISEGEADVPQVLVVFLVAFHVLPLTDSLGQIHHGQGDLDLGEQGESGFLMAPFGWPAGSRGEQLDSGFVEGSYFLCTI